MPHKPNSVTETPSQNIHAMNECLELTKAAAGAVSDTAAALQQKLKENPAPYDFPKTLLQAITGLDAAIAQTIRQWREIASQIPRFYDLPDKENLTYRTIDEAVLHILDQWPDLEFPETIEIAHYHPIIIEPPANTLDLLIENLNQENAGDDNEGGVERPTPAMLEAERRFVETILLEFPGYWLEQRASTHVNVRQWMPRHWPELLSYRNFTTALCGHCLQPAGAQTTKTCQNCLRRACSRCWTNTEPKTPDWANCQRKLSEKQALSR